MDRATKLIESATLEAPPVSVPSVVNPHPLLGEAHRLAAVLAARWREGEKTPRLLLCFDAGDGLASAALCQAVPEINAAVVVTPAAVGRTEGLFDACGLARRCLVYAGNPLDPPVHETYDRVVLFHALYPVRKSMGEALAAAAARLAPGGELCSVHWFCQEACASVPDGPFDHVKAALTGGHPLCHVEQFCQRLEEVGLGETVRTELAGEYGATKLHFGRRPAGA